MLRSIIQFVSTVFCLLVINHAQADNLLDVYQLAADNDPQFRAAEAAYRAALEAKPQSRALLLPSLVFNANKSKNHQTVNSASNPASIGSSDYDSDSYSLTLTQPLFHQDYLVQLRQSNALIGQASAERAVAQQDLIIRVAVRYFAILAAIDNLEFARAEKNAIERQLEQTQQRYEVGLIAITDVHESQAAFDLAVAQEIEAENLLSSTVEALRETTGRHHDSLSALTIDMPLITPEPADINQWTKTALEQNFQLIAAGFAYQAAQDNIKQQRSGHYPTLDLTASLVNSDTEGGTFGQRDAEDRSVGIQLSLPIYQGGAVSSRKQQAQFQAEQAKELQEQIRRGTLRQTRDAYLSILATIKRVKALKQAVVSAQSALDATEAGYEVGTRTTVDVLEVRRRLFLAQRNHAGSRYDYILNTLRLKQAAGTLIDKDIEQINRWTQ